MSLLSIFVALMSIVPALILLTYFGARKGKCFLYGLLGALGWLLALGMRVPLIRIPLSLFGVPLALTVRFSLYTSFLAGLFEEFTRFSFIYSLKPRGMGEVASIGLGWGIFEAMVAYLLPVLPFAGLYPPMALLLGAIERNSAIAIHVGLSIIIAKAVKERWLVIAAILSHYLIDVITTLLFRIYGVWISEILISVMAVILLVPSVLSYKKYALSSPPDL